MTTRDQAPQLDSRGPTSNGKEGMGREGEMMGRKGPEGGRHSLAQPLD